MPFGISLVHHQINMKEIGQYLVKKTLFWLFSVDLDNLWLISIIYGYKLYKTFVKKFGLAPKLKF